MPAFRQAQVVSTTLDCLKAVEYAIERNEHREEPTRPGWKRRGYQRWDGSVDGRLADTELWSRVRGERPADGWTCGPADRCRGFSRDRCPRLGWRHWRSGGLARYRQTNHPAATRLPRRGQAAAVSALGGADVCARAAGRDRPRLPLRAIRGRLHGLDTSVRDDRSERSEGRASDARPRARPRLRLLRSRAAQLARPVRCDRRSPMDDARERGTLRANLCVVCVQSSDPHDGLERGVRVAADADAVQRGL